MTTPQETLPEHTMTEYLEICRSHHAITDFRAKLLALLPVASGAGLFLLLSKNQKSLDLVHLPAIGVFGFLVTLGLFFYELRGIQLCKALKERCKLLEEQLRLTGRQFSERPRARLGGLIGAEGAAWIIYPTVLLSWVYVAIIRFI
ncbi:MAG TPA: hypothetical protein VFO40_08715 [Chthoniobacterales bacterium]|nr:hypothetical protein [Chthoniobacterales bacterium]